MTGARRILVLLAVWGLAATTVAQAGVFKRVAVGLSEAGFNFAGERNFLSGGADMTVSRNWTGETLDFGATELTLTGPMVFQFSTGGRGLNVLDISLNTADTPLNYTLVNDVGSQKTTIDGSLLVDATGSMNMFGWYDLTLQVSSRQDITEDGRFANSETENDFDIGPINIRGNLFADVLATLTEPLFRSAGTDNIFASFSGARQFEQQLSAQAEEALAKARLGQPLTAEDVAELAALASAATAFGFEPPDLSELLGDVVIETGDLALGDQRGRPVPEPASVVLIALGAAVALGRTRGWRG